jgi:ribonuclease BN (tRNA processing enzyme)
LRTLAAEPTVRKPITLFSLVVLIVACQAATPIDYSRGTHLVLLGTGTPNPDPDRAGSGVAIVVNGTPYLVDAGVGVVRRAAAVERNGVAALEAENLDRVFVTHLHSDHTLGLADLIFTPWVLERERPLEAYGPGGLVAMTDHLVAAYEVDVRRRVDGLQPQNATGHHVNVHVVQPGEIYRDSNVTVTAFPVSHEEWDEAYGYRFETADRVIVISGDTRPSENVVAACNGCDILVHEVYSDAGFAQREPEWQRYHASAHTSASELAQIAGRAQPGLLVLYHQLFMGTSEEGLVAEVRAGYDGRVVSGRDLDIY